MRKLETDNFVLSESLTNPNGDSTWTITKKSNNRIFYIHVFNKNQLNIKFYGFIEDAHEAISLLCNTIAEETSTSPCINIHHTNQALIKTCIRAGFRKKRNIKHLYIYRKKA